MAAEPGHRRSLTVALVIIVIAVGALLAWKYFPRNADDDPSNGSPSPISEADARKLLTLRNLGISQLENGDYAEADSSFSEIVERLPNDLLGHRNLLITRVLAVGELLSQIPTAETPAKIAEAKQKAESAIAATKKLEQKSVVPHWLAVRLYASLSEKSPDDDSLRRRFFDEIDAGLGKDDSSVVLWYEKYKAHDLQFDDDNRQRARDAMKRAFQLRPTNLVLISLGLLAQAESHDPELADNLERVKTTVKPIAQAILKRNGRHDLMKILETALDLLKKKPEPNWAAVRGQVILLKHLIVAEHAKQLDEREVQPHELEFVVTDFGSSFYERAALPEETMLPSNLVQMKPAAGAWKFPDLDDVQAVKLVDFNLDGRVDVIVARAKSIQVYEFNRQQKHWELICKADLPFVLQGLAVADLDDDVPKPAADAPSEGAAARKPGAQSESQMRADVDLVAYGQGGIVVLRNERDPKSGKRSLQPMKQAADFPAQVAVHAVAIADLDHDSDLDLVVSGETGMFLLMNRGDMMFDNTSEHSTLPPAEFKPTSLIPIDFNRDVHIDVVLADPKSKSAGYLENIRHGQFRFKKFPKEFSALGQARSLSSVDADGNVSWDWIAASDRGVQLTLTQTIDSGRYRFLKSKAIAETPVTAATTWDYDNDGYLDVLAWSPERLTTFRGGPNGRFQKTDSLFEDAPNGCTACEIADVDGDGDLDVVAIVSKHVRLFLNEGGNANNWIEITLRAEGDPKNKQHRCNNVGIGSLLELKSGAIYQPRLVTGAMTHFGLGKQKSADVVRVLWTNGVPQNVLTPQSRKPIVAEQKLLLGSCPYLYTWTGKKYEFLTDLLWAAPIGLQFADGVLAPSRAEEFLKIPGEKLVPIAGEYRIQITEELWEAGYFDSVKLYAIDHPADVEIYSNEKVGPQSIAKYRVHTARSPRIPVAARDQTGRDVLPLIKTRDDRYLQAYSHRLIQGLTPEHFLELDLGKLRSPKRITLFLTGWVFPTDTSINVWLSHQKELPPPQPPSVWVPDENGEWKNVIPYMGFPGGKTKTIAIDLSNAFLTDDYRLRIKTMMELRWDAAFFTVDEAPAETRITELTVNRAELFYRGFSRRIDRPHHAPETYDFHTVDTQPHWPPMDGRFTRYGDVTELLKADDDRLVVIGAGDTMTLRFLVPKTPVPVGWKRDFFIRNVGWDKDANMNTVAGQTVEPLPFLKMPSYPFPPSVDPPNSKPYRDYLRTYQTRRQPAARFWRAIGSVHP